MFSIANVTVVTVTHNSSAVINSLLASLPDDVPVIVVDNASSDDTVARSLRHRRLVVKSMSQNIGFGSACNVGALLAETPFLFFVNPDATLEPECIKMLLEAASRYSERTAFNPRTFNTDGKLSLRLSSRAERGSRLALNAAPTTDIPLKVLNGAALFIRREHFADIGGFDEGIFLYFEDDDLSLRLLQAGFALQLAFESVVYHQGGSSTSETADLARFKSYHWMKSYRYVTKKHGGADNRYKRLARAVPRWFFAALTLNAVERYRNEGLIKALLES